MVHIHSEDQLTLMAITDLNDARADVQEGDYGRALRVTLSATMLLSELAPVSEPGPALLERLRSALSDWYDHVAEEVASPVRDINAGRRLPE